VRLIERIWRGDGGGDAIARAALTPLEALYSIIVTARGALYDRGVFAVHSSSIPVVSVGNLTVGGTGKTPVASWIASRLIAVGLKPAIVLRGYGGDEPLVHERLNSGVAVVVDSDRVSGISRAAASGAGVAILDDAFQHRRAARDVDLVLVSADDWTGRHDVLPAGPYREPMSALRRASAVIVTRKAADDRLVNEVTSAVARFAPAIPVAVVRLDLGDLVSVADPAAHLPLESIQGRTVLAIAGVGNNEAFFSQIEGARGNVIRRSYSDHHRFDGDDAADLARLAAEVDFAICTLKDAVKLAPLWTPDRGPLWYVSLAVSVERGEPALDDLLMRL
jgi:tetraacyldisaccharide 4'-kinase